jgi:hypothetical protein
MDVCGQIQMPANLRTKLHTIIYVVVGLLGGMESNGEKNPNETHEGS